MHKKPPTIAATKILLSILLTIFLVEACLMLLIHLAKFSNPLMNILFDALALPILLAPSLYLFAYKPLLKANRELSHALEEIKTLKGIIPICAYCKKIRDDKEIWQQMEDYISDHSDAQFSHGMCPDCYAEQLVEVQMMKKGHQKRVSDKTYLP